jgi:hypothetical protein
MTIKEKIIKAFIAEKLQINETEINEGVFNTINASINLEIGESNEADEIRSISLLEDTDGKVTAKSIKLYNLMRVSLYDIVGFCLKETSILFTEDNKVKIIYALMNLLLDFYPKLTYSFNDTDAKILMAIWNIRKSTITIDEINASYSQLSSTIIEISQLQRSLEFFKTLRVLKYLGNDQYQVKEKIIYERN